MSNRTVRVSELMQREISAYLHTRYQGEAVRITITGVIVSPDFHDGRVFYSVLGDAEQTAECGRWLQAKLSEIRRVVARQIVLKRVPLLELVLDTGPERGTRVIRLLDEVEHKEHPSP
jgi:ribosome-binding factor A